MIDDEWKQEVANDDAALKPTTKLDAMTPAFELPPNGDRAKESLPIEISDCGLRSLGFAEGAQATFDWHNDHLQILIFDNQDDPALHIRFNQDGTIAEIVAREWFNLLPEGRARPQSAWEISRDGKVPQ